MNLFLFILSILALYKLSPAVDFALYSIHEYSVLCLFLVFYSIVLLKPRATLLKRDHYLRLALVSIILFSLVHACLTPNSFLPDMRYILICLTTISVQLVDEGLLERFFQFFSAGLILLTGTTFLLYSLANLNFVDIDPWFISNFDLAGQGFQIYDRWDNRGEPFYLLYYLLVISENIDFQYLDLDFFRFYSIFTEPTFLAYVLLPLCFHALHAKAHDPKSLIKFLIFATALLISGAVFGVLILVLSFLAFYTMRFIAREKLLGGSAAIILCLSLLFYHNALYDLFFSGVKTVAPHKVDELTFLKTALTEGSILPSFSWLGSGFIELDQFYGKLHILAWQGIIGVVLFSILSIIYLKSLYLCAKQNMLCLFCMGFCCMGMFFKLPEIVGLYYLLVLQYISVQLNRSQQTTHKPAYALKNQNIPAHTTS